MSRGFFIVAPLILFVPLLILGGWQLWQRAYPYTLTTTTGVDASAEEVWEVLADFEACGEWNPTIVEIEGKPEPGEELEFSNRSPDGRITTFRPTVLVSEPGRELRWHGHLPVPGIFSGEHYFLIEELAEERVRLEHKEAFRGVAVPLFRDRLERETLPGFEAMNAALKERVEAGTERPESRRVS